MPSSGEGPSPLGTWRVGVRPGVCADPPERTALPPQWPPSEDRENGGGVGHRGMQLYWAVQF